MSSIADLLAAATGMPSRISGGRSAAPLDYGFTLPGLAPQMGVQPPLAARQPPPQAGLNPYDVPIPDQFGPDYIHPDGPPDPNLIYRYFNKNAKRRRV